MVNNIPICLALTPWTPPSVPQQNSTPVKHCITIQPIEIFIDEEQEFAHRRSNESEDLGYDQHGHLLQRPKRGLIIDFHC
jgi:hypothetical protein